MKPRELTDAEIDVLLERFDQTEPALQRRIIAKFVADRVVFEELVRRAVEARIDAAWLADARAALRGG